MLMACAGRICFHFLCRQIEITSFLEGIPLIYLDGSWNRSSGNLPLSGSFCPFYSMSSINSLHTSLLAVGLSCMFCTGILQAHLEVAH